MHKFYKIGFFVLAFLIIGGGAFYVGWNKDKLFPKSTPSPTPTLSQKKESTITVTQSSSPTPTVAKAMSTQELIENLKATVSSKNYQAAESYMTDTVGVAIESSECCGTMTKAEATKQLDYLNSATNPWNFDQSNDTVKKLKSTDPTDYGPDSTIIGIAANEYVAAFKVNAANKITGLTLAVTYKLVLP